MGLKILQLGDGRWAQNHKRILKGMGHEVKTLDVECKWWDELKKAKKQHCDAVIVTTTTVNHWPIGKMCMEMGIPVFIEKPILLKRTQLEELKKLAPKNLMMAGHQLVFMPEVYKLKDKVKYMNSERSGAIPRSEGSLFSLMVHDIAVAHYVTGLDEFKCIWAEGNRHEIKATLRGKNGVYVDLHAVSVSKVRLRHTTFITENSIKHMNPDNWGRLDILTLELTAFCGYVEQKKPITFNGADQAIKVMQTVFTIEDELNSKKG